MKSFEDFLSEDNKSGDSSLSDWFSKSQSDDGTKGWVQIGGPHAGSPCAKQPGQKSKPKCGSSKMRRELDKKEEDKAFRRKNRQDGDADRRGKARNVATENAIKAFRNENDRQLDEKAGEKDACYNKVKKRFKIWPSAYASGALVQCRKKGADNWGNKSSK